MDNVFSVNNFKNVLQDIVNKSLDQAKAEERIVGYLNTMSDGKNLSVKLEVVDILSDYEFPDEKSGGVSSYLPHFVTGMWDFMGEVFNYSHNIRDKSYYTPYSNFTELWENTSFKGEGKVKPADISIPDIIKAIGANVPTTNYQMSFETFTKALDNFTKLGVGFVLNKQWEEALIHPAISFSKEINIMDSNTVAYMVKLIDHYAKSPHAQAPIINNLKYAIAQIPAIKFMPIFENYYKISGGNLSVFKENAFADELSSKAFWCLDSIFLNLKDSQFTKGNEKFVNYLLDAFANNFTAEELQKLIIAGSTHIVEQNKEIQDEFKITSFIATLLPRLLNSVDDFFKYMGEVITYPFNPYSTLSGPEIIPVDLGSVMTIIEKVVIKYKQAVYKDTADYNPNNFAKLVDIIIKTKDIEVIKYLSKNILSSFDKSLVTEEMKIDLVLISIKQNNAAVMKFILSESSILKIDDINTIEILVNSVLSNGHDINIIFSALSDIMDQTLFNALKGPIMKHVYDISPNNLNNSYNKYNILANKKFVELAKSSFSSTEFDDLFNKIIVPSYQNSHKVFFFNLFKAYKDLILSDVNKLNKIFDMASFNMDFDIIKIINETHPDFDKTQLALKYIYQGNFNMNNFKSLEELGSNANSFTKMFGALDTRLFDKCNLKEVILNGLKHNLEISSDSNKYQAVIQMLHRYKIAESDTLQFVGKIRNDKILEKKLVVENHLSELVDKYMVGAKTNLLNKLTENITDPKRLKSITEQLGEIFSNNEKDGFFVNLMELRSTLPNKTIPGNIVGSYEGFLFFYHAVTQKISDDYFASNSAIAGIHIDKLAHDTLVYKAVEGDFNVDDISRIFKFGHKSVVEKANILNYSIHTSWHDSGSAYLDGEKVALDMNHAVNQIHKNGMGIVIEAVLPKGSPQVCGPHKLDWDLIPNQLHSYEVKAIHIVENGEIIDTYDNNDYAGPLKEITSSTIHDPYIVGDEFTNSEEYYTSHTESKVSELENNYYSFNTDYVI